MRYFVWLICVLWLMTGTVLAGDPVVIPVRLDAGKLLQQEIHSGEDAFVRLEYCLKPGGEVVFCEEAEKVWWLSEQPVLMLAHLCT